MSRFNTRTAGPAASSPVTTTGERTTTHEGATGYLRDPRSELFLLAVSNFVGNDTFYEKAGDRDDRYQRLIRRLAIEDPAWTASLLKWLRGEGNMRTASLVGAAEFAKARLDAEKEGDLAPDARAAEAAGVGWNRQVIASVLQRPDEPGEMLAYWTSTYGRRIPKPVKRGVADAVRRLYTERALLKYDTASRGYRFGDVLELVHASPNAPWQGDLFRYAIDRRHRSDAAIPAHHRILAADVALRHNVRRDPETLLDSETLRNAGMTWEAALSLAGDRLDKARLWEALIPTMGLMALARNLRNFDEASVSDEFAQRVCARFTDAEEVARSRMFPFRWWAAYKHAPSLRWGHALEQVLGHSLVNVPQLTGATLILVDRSPSMFPGYHFSTPGQSDITLAEQAAVFGAALALRAEKPTLVEFGGQSREVPVPKGGSIMRLINSFGQIDGTDIPTAVKKHWRAHDRIVIVTDEQTQPGWLPSNMATYGGMRETRIDDLVPKDVPVYLWNLAGYKAGVMPSGASGRHCFGGLTDHSFRAVPLLERGRDARWPWEGPAA